MEYLGLRSVFFGDQDVCDKDLNNIEYTKIKTIRDSLAACIKQPGVVIDSLSDTALKVVGGVINSGTALDKFGRLIYVPDNISVSGSISTDPYYHPVWPSRTPSGSGNYINIYYDVQYDIPEADDSGNIIYIRIYDSYKILAENSLPTEESGGICLSNGGVDCRPILYFRGHSTLIPADDVWANKSQASGSVNAQVSVDNLSWNNINTATKKAELSFKRYSNENFLYIKFIVDAFYFNGNLSVTINDSITENIIISKSYNFSPTSMTTYVFPIDITSLNVDSLYFIRIFLSTSGIISIRGIIFYTD